MTTAVVVTMMSVVVVVTASRPGLRLPLGFEASVASRYQVAAVAEVAAAAAAAVAADVEGAAQARPVLMVATPAHLR